MPLILAIESDKRQANQLTAMVRGRLRAELVLADAAEPALAALGGRVPDLILTSPLLSTKDEAALAGHLRELGDAAAHVHSLTIPVLDTPLPRMMPGRGMLSTLLGDRVSSPAAPDGCDPAVFAEQCAEYLERAKAERTGHSFDEPEAVEPPVPIFTPAPPVVSAPEPVPDPDPVLVEPPPASDADPIFAMLAPPVLAPTVAEPQPPPAPVQEPMVAAMEPPPAPREAATEKIEESVEIDLTAMLDETVFQQLSAAIESVSRDSAHQPMAPAPGIEAWTPSSLGSAAVWPAMNLAPSEKPRTQAPASTGARRFPDRKPLQDEWGLFDPAQCGFSALLAKLDEITHVAPPLPGADPSAGSPNVNR
jgi:hypothetical protein